MNGSGAATPQEVRTSRGVAVLGGATAVAHVPLAVAHAAVSLPLAAVLLAMALVCLPCTGHLWRSPSRRTWSRLAGVGTVMLLAHAGLLLADAPAAGVVSGTLRPPAGHGAHVTALGAAGWLHSPASFGVLSALTALQVVVCLLLLRGRLVPLRDAAPVSTPVPIPDHGESLQV